MGFLDTAEPAIPVAVAVAAVVDVVDEGEGGKGIPRAGGIGSYSSSVSLLESTELVGLGSSILSMNCHGARSKALSYSVLDCVASSLVMFPSLESSRCSISNTLWCDDKSLVEDLVCS